MADQDDNTEKTDNEKPPSQSPSPPKSPKPKSPKEGRSGSAKKGTAKKDTKSAKGRDPSPKKREKGGRRSTIKEPKKKKDEKPVEEPAADDENPKEALPVGAQPIFLASKTQEIFQCIADQDVTEENGFKLIKKDDLVIDMRTRAAVSDFSPFKQIIIDYPAEELLIVYDIDFKYGQNFYIALTEEAKEKILNPPAADGDAIDGEEKEEGEQVVYQYIPPEPKDWISQGSEKEITEAAIIQNRALIQMSVKRIRREFGAPVTFNDRNVADAKDGFIDCTTYEDPSYSTKKVEMETGTQAIPTVNEMGTQTDWKHPRNAKVQYVPREFTEEEKAEQEKAEKLQEFAKSCTTRFEVALQQNEIVNVFFNDWEDLGDEDASFGGKSDTHLKEYQSFTDLKFSKHKTVTCIDWHPTIKGLIGVSCAERMTFDERIDNSAKIVMNPSLILIWSFVDPIHPMLLLEAPDDILCFKFCPTDPNIVAGGCVNGQVVLWDVSAYGERLKAQRTSREIKKDSLNSLPGFDDGSGLDTPIVRYCAVSSIENSHKAGITDILWVPDHYEVNRMGYALENRSQNCTQVMTCATDHTVLFWDTKSPKTQQQDSSKKESDIKNPMGVPTTFKHLDLTWKPLLRVYLSRSEPGGDHSPVKFSIQEKQGDRSVLNKLSDNKLEKESSQTGGFNFGKPASGKEKRTLQDVTTKFYVGGEDGEIIYLDWMPQKDQDSGKIQTPKPEFYSSIHAGPISTLQRSPFFKDIILCIGGWSFTIWKEGVNSGPILSTCSQPKRLTGGFWSPTRPGLIYICRSDGNIDIWDLLDRTHEPSQTQNVTAHSITTIYPYGMTTTKITRDHKLLTRKQHLLAVGDTSGTLHILEIPWSLRHPTPNELTSITNYFDREVKRRAFVMARWDFREQEKRQIEAEAKMKAGIAPNVQLTEDEIEYKMKLEYNAYVEEENTFLRELGLVKEEEEILPEV